MNTEQLELAHACALGVLDEEDRRAVEALRQGRDLDLRTEFATAIRQARETLATVSLVTAVQPPPLLFERVLDRILEDDLALPDAPPDQLAARRRGTRWRWALGAAAAVAVFAGGAVIGGQLRETSSVTDAQRVIAADDLQSARISLPDGGIATALYSKHSDAAVVLLVDAPAPAAGTVYQMWLLGDAPQPVSAGLLTDVSATTTAVVTHLGSATTLAFTVEPAGGSPQPTSTPFAVLSLT